MFAFKVDLLFQAETLSGRSLFPAVADKNQMYFLLSIKSNILFLRYNKLCLNNLYFHFFVKANYVACPKANPKLEFYSSILVL